MRNDDLNVRSARIGLFACQHFIKDDAERIDIGATVERHAFGLFRADIVRAAERGAIFRQPVVRLGLLGHPEIGEHRGSIPAEQDVCRLDVAVNDVFSVHIFQAATDRFHQFQGLVRTHTLYNPVLEIATLQIFHGEIVPLAGDANVINGDDVVMFQGGDNTAFIDKAGGLKNIVELFR